MKMPNYDDYVDYCKSKGLKPIHEFIHVKIEIIKPLVTLIIIWAYRKGVDCKKRDGGLGT